jgi:hypothetical protein
MQLFHFVVSSEVDENMSSKINSADVYPAGGDMPVAVTVTWIERFPDVCAAKQPKARALALTRAGAMARSVPKSITPLRRDEYILRVPFTRLSFVASGSLTKNVNYTRWD